MTPEVAGSAAVLLPDGLIDAHLHLQDPALAACRDAVDPLLAGQLVHATHPDDWQAVVELPQLPGLRRWVALGVHPWKVDALPQTWQQTLRRMLQQTANVISVGEIGLDHWIEPRDAALQERIFRSQLAIAAAFGLPPTIHCLRAWDDLLRVLRDHRPLCQGFLMHGFAGSLQHMDQLLELGAFFSFSAYAADPQRKRMRAAINHCPDDRLLLETDAPSMAPPPALARFPLAAKDGRPIHHPMEIIHAQDCVAAIRDQHPDAVRKCSTANFFRLFDEANPQATE